MFINPNLESTKNDPSIQKKRATKIANFFWLNNCKLSLYETHMRADPAKAPNHL